jgi:hypothetical protein
VQSDTVVILLLPRCEGQGRDNEQQSRNELVPTRGLDTMAQLEVPIG